MTTSQIITGFRTENLFKKWVLFGGIFNCAAAAPMALPWTVGPYFDLFNALNNMLGLSGVPMSLNENPNTMPWVNTAGLALLLVGMSLLYAARDLKHRSGVPLLNGVVRLLWAFLAAYYLVGQNALAILYLIVVIDLMLAFQYIRFYLKNEGTMAVGPET